MRYSSPFTPKDAFGPCGTKASRYRAPALLIALLLLLLVSPGVSRATEHALSGKATWYGNSAHGKQTANGETFNRNKLTAAHLTLPFGTVLRVYNLRNGSQALVRVTDRGPFGKGRVVDLSYRSAQLLRMTNDGVVPVAMEIVAGANGKPLTKGNGFYLHLANERHVLQANRTSYELQSRTGLPVRALFSAQGDQLGFVLCAGPYKTFAEAESAFLKVEKKYPALGIIEAPTDGGNIPKHIPPGPQKRQPLPARGTMQALR